MHYHTMHICNSTAVAIACIACMYIYVHRTCMHVHMHARSYSAKQHASTRKHNAATNIINFKFKHAPTDIDLE